jgi:hypothetical protein
MEERRRTRHVTEAGLGSTFGNEHHSCLVFIEAYSMVGSYKRSFPVLQFVLFYPAFLAQEMELTNGRGWAEDGLWTGNYGRQLCLALERYDGKKT